MEKLEQLYEGKAKKVYKTDDPNQFIIEYKDDATAFNGEKKGSASMNATGPSTSASERTGGSSFWASRFPMTMTGRPLTGS